MKAVVIYESLTGNTRKAAAYIAGGLEAGGIPTTVCPITEIDYAALSEAELVVVGTWTDGIIIAGQRPGRAGRLKKMMPALQGKWCVVYATYAIDAGKVLHKLARMMEDLGADVLGGDVIRRDKIEAGCRKLVDQVLAAVPA
jgi:menaquinone-dependent protoporphyrinogen IX oxidase